MAKSFKGKQVYIALLFFLVVVSLSLGLKTFNTDNELTGAISTRTDKITIVEYGDFLCPFCAMAQDTLNQLKEIYGDDLRIIYKHLPLHDGSFEFAVASECANEQGKFWGYHDYLYANQKTIKIEDVSLYAQELGLNVDKFNQCLNGEDAKAKVNSDWEDAKELGLNGTPTFFVNGEKILGAQPIETFKKVIESKL